MSFDNRYLRFALLLVAACATMAGQQWVNLFDGKTLNGWAVHEGTGKISSRLARQRCRASVRGVRCAELFPSVTGSL